MGRPGLATASLFVITFFAAAVASAQQERLCDASVENCRTQLISLINNEHVGIDVGVWFFKDDRYVTALVNAKSRGVPIRILMDPRANATYPTNKYELDRLQAAGIPMRKRIAGDILHWKLMLFAGQGIVEWSGANFSPTAFVPITPYQNYEDEVIYYSHALVPSFMTKFDDIWTNTTEYANYANVTGPLARNYPTYPVDARLNFPPKDSYQDRLVPLIDKEPAGGLIDLDMYRITMARPVDALIRAAARGVRQRLYLEPNEYSNPNRPGNKVQMDRLVSAAKTYPGTIEIRMRAHDGLNHQKTVWLHAQHIVVFGTSNWSDASDDNQLEANIFTDVRIADGLNDMLFTDLNKIFERKFYNEAPDGSVETVAWRTPSLPRPVMPGTCQDPAATNYGGPLPCQYPPPPPPPAPLPSPWQTQDIGSVGRTGSAGASGGTFTVTGAGADIWGTADAFRYAYQSLAGDGTIVARVATVDNINSATKAGVMIRETTAAGSIHASLFVTPAKGITFARRTATGGTTVSTHGNGVAPVWLRLVRAGQVITASTSTNGSTWTDIGQDTIASSASVLIGLAVTSHDATKTATATFDNVAVTGGSGGTPPPSLPAPWKTGDIGAVGPAGDASESAGTFTITGSGADVWGTADAFRYVYQPLAGDGTIVARVAAVDNVNSATKAGVMIRQTLDAGSIHASLFVTPAKGITFARRTAAGGTTVSTHASGAAPVWLRLVRAGQVVTASTSTDGTTWTNVDQQTVPFSGSVFIGLAITSHDNTKTASATIDNVTVQ